MRKINVKVERNGKRRPPARLRAAMLRQRATNALRAVLIRPRLLVAGALAGTVLFVGTPHIGWDYECSHQMRGIGTCRSASWCAYYGVQGRRIDIPESGEICDLVKFIRIDWTRLTKGLTNGE